MPDDNELCTLPLTFDFEANPFRCRKGSSQGSKHLLHALLAVSMQHVSRMNEIPADHPISQQIAAYKSSAAELCTVSILEAPEKSKSLVLDTVLVLFCLDVRATAISLLHLLTFNTFQSLTSATGPWNARLLDAYQKIESIGGMSALAASPRMRAQLGMFIWLV